MTRNLETILRDDHVRTLDALAGAAADLVADELIDGLLLLAATAPESSALGPYAAGVAKGRKDGLLKAVQYIRDWAGSAADVPTVAEEMRQQH